MLKLSLQPGGKTGFGHDNSKGLDFYITPFFLKKKNKKIISQLKDIHN